MKKIYSFLLSVFLLLIGSLNVWGTTYKLKKVTLSSEMVAGGLYVFERNSRVLNNTVTSKALQTTETYATSGLLGTESYIWTLETKEGTEGAYLLRNIAQGNTTPYLHNASSTTMSLSASTSSSAWKFEFTEGECLISNTNDRFLGETETNSNAYKAYAKSNLSSYGHDFTVYKLEEEALPTSISVATAPTQTEFAVGEEFSSDGLTLTANYAEGDPEIISAGFTFKIGDDDLEDGDALSTKGTKTVTISYGGQTCSQAIYVGELKSISVTTPPTKKTYDEGQTFDPTGMVVTAAYNTDDGHSWTTAVNDYTYDPTTALAPANTSVTISYGGKSTTQTITVNEGVPYTVTFNAGTGSCATASLTEASFSAGVELPTATIGVTGWSFAGWATASTANTSDEPTLYAAEDTYHPTDNVTLYAVYTFSGKSTTQYSQASTLSEITGASSIVIVNGSYVLDNTLGGSVSAPSVTDGIMEPNTKDIFAISGNNTDGFTLTNGTKRLGGASSSDVTLATDASNYLWTFAKIGETTNFQVLSKNIAGEALERYKPKSGSYSWKTYTSNTTDIYQMKIYVPTTNTVYNSNPAAIVNPTVTFANAANKTLYLQGETGYTNAANVTGISKTIEYSSSDATVATVSEAGVVTAVKTGTTTITASVAAEVGVNTEASASYTITVKDASDIAGLKAITSTSSVVSFTADLTDAVVTYVKENYAYIQDASGAIYASCGSDLTVGKKINGAISGSIKAANQIDEITAIDLSAATVTEDGVIPEAVVKTAAQLVEDKANLEGKLVRITDAKVTASLTSGSASGGKISDDNNTTEINLYAPASNIDALKDAEGTFNGYISLYNGNNIRFNIYEQSQIVLTKNAPTTQTLTFENDEVILDEETSAYEAFEGQTVSGAKGAVTYSIESDDDDVVESINASTGAITLSGNLGTATITATAAAKEVTEAGVTTPYTETEKSYTVTVRPRYTVMFSINGIETELREVSYGAGVIVPTPYTIGGYTFIGWRTSTLDPTDTDPDDYTDLDATFHPTDNDDVYYAVYAIAGGTPEVEHTSTFTIKQASAPSSPFISDGSSWTWNNLTFDNSNSACINKTNGTITFSLPSGARAKSLTLTSTDNSWAKAATVVLKDASSNTLHSFTKNSLSYNFTSGSHDKSTSYTLSNSTSSNAWVDHIDFEYVTGGISYSDYTTSVSSITLSLTADTWSSYAFPMDVTIPDNANLKVYKAALNAEEDQLIATPISGNLKKGEGVLVKASATDDYTFDRFVGSAEELEDNQLVGNLVATPTATLKEDYSCTYIMVLGKGTNAFGSFAGASLPANKAFLPYTPSGSAAPIRIVEAQNNATYLDGIKEREMVVKFFENGQIFIKKNGVVYDALGRKVR